MDISVEVKPRKKSTHIPSTINEQYIINITNVGFFEKVFKKHLPNGTYRVFVLNPHEITLHNITIKNRSKYLGNPPDYIIDAINEFKQTNGITLQGMRDQGIW